MPLSRENTARITDLLRDNPQGLSITDIVKKIAINRNTAGRYLENLLIAGQVEMRHFGMAKIYALSNRIPQSAMLSISSDLVMQLDSSLRIVFANEPFLNLLRVTASDLTGKNIEYTAAVLIFEDAIDDFITVLKTGVAGKEWHGTLALKKGDLFFSCYIAPTVFNDGRKGVSVRLEDLTELRHHEHALQESEARVRSIISAAPIGIGVVTDRVIMEVNNRLCEMTGYKAGELIGKPARMLYLTEEEYEIVGREKYELIARTGSGTVQTQWKRKDGGIIDILLSSAPLNPADLSRGVTFTALDITVRTRAEQALRESEERYRKLVEISPDAVILHRHGKIIYANPAAQALLGAPGPEKIVGKYVLDFVDPGSRRIVSENIKKDLGGEFSPQTELQMLRLDGTPVTVEGRGVQTLIEGEPAILVAIRNITKRKQTEEKLVESERKYRFVAENSLDIISRQTPEGILTYVSPVVTQVLGYHEGEVLGRSLPEMVHPDDLPRVRQDLLHITRDEINRVTSSFRIRHRDGHYLWFESTTNVIRDKQSGKILELFSISREITQRKLLESQMDAGAERYRQLAECSLDALVVTDLRGDVITTNRAALALIEADDLKAVHGRSVFSFIAPESLERAKRDLAAMGPERKGVMQTYKGITARGNRITVEVLGNRIMYNGTTANIISIRDVSKRTLFEENLKKSEHMYRQLADNSIDIINHHNADFILTYMSPAIRTILGYNPEDAIGRCVLDFVYPEDVPVVVGVHNSLVSKETETATLVYRMVHRNGQMVWLESTVRAIPNPLTGEVAEFYNVTRDITLRKVAEENAHRRDRVLHGFAAASGFLLTGRLKDPFPRVLSTIGEAMGADVSYIYQDILTGTDSSHTAVRRYRWAKETTRSDTGRSSTCSSAENHFPTEWSHRLASGIWISGCISRCSIPDREVLEDLGIHSILLVPIFVRGVYWGFIGTSDLSTDRVWADSEIEILMTLASTLGIVLEQKEENRE
ncbi:MAG: PAS domain S-box protein [Methanoregula sp.]|nr:PAS domain S-box protein [Methanoregula sp.]